MVFKTVQSVQEQEQIDLWGGVHKLTHRPSPHPKGDASSRGGLDAPPKGVAGGGPDPSPLRVASARGGSEGSQTAPKQCLEGVF